MGHQNPPLLSRRAAGVLLQFTRRQLEKAIEHRDVDMVVLGEGSRDQYITLASVETLIARTRGGYCPTDAGTTRLLFQAAGRVTRRTVAHGAG